MENVEVRNFLNDYESLIHVENDNYVVRQNKDYEEILAIQYGNFESLAKIEVKNCNIYDGNFANGMIYVLPMNIFNESNWNFTLVRQNINQKGFESKSFKDQQSIKISGSWLHNLYYGRVIHGLHQLGSEFATSNGIVLSVHNY